MQCYGRGRAECAFDDHSDVDECQWRRKKRKRGKFVGEEEEEEREEEEKEESAAWDHLMRPAEVNHTKYPRRRRRRPLTQENQL